MQLLFFIQINIKIKLNITYHWLFKQLSDKNNIYVPKFKDNQVKKMKRQFIPKIIKYCGLMNIKYKLSERGLKAKSSILVRLSVPKKS